MPEGVINSEPSALTLLIILQEYVEAGAAALGAGGSALAPGQPTDGTAAGTAGAPWVRRKERETMTDRVLRWLSAVALVLLVLDAVLKIVTLSSFAAHPMLTLPLEAFKIPQYILGYQVLPTTAISMGEVTGIAVLVVSLQRRQWGWFSGMLLCLVVASYAGLGLDVPAITTLLSNLSGGGGGYSQAAAVQLYFVVAYTPMVVLAGIYAWTRRQPAASMPTA